MRISISNLSGEQQNVLCHLSKNLKTSLHPLLIICYGHRSSINFQSSAFITGGMAKKKFFSFDILVMVRNDEVLPDVALQELARRSCSAGSKDNILIFRMKEVMRNLSDQNRFFAAVFRYGIMLYGNKHALNQLPRPLPPACFTNKREKEVIYQLRHHVQCCLNEVEQSLKSCDTGDSYLNIILLNEAACTCAKYFMAAHWGIELQGDFRQLLRFSENITDELNHLFPRNTMEEAILFHILNLSFIDEGFCPGPLMIETLFKRISIMFALSHRFVQKKIAQLLEA